MSFIDAYKKLERLCSDSFNEPHGVSSYIEQMKSISDGERYVPSWSEDLKMLKHCRWARNKIVHEPEYTEANTCEKGDEEWIKRFHSRMLNGTDPLTMYRRAKSSVRRPVPPRQTQINREFIEQYNNRESSQDGCLGFLSFIFIVFVLVSVLLLAY